MDIPKLKTLLFRNTKSSKSGFTLIEILIVFTIMSLLTGLGFAGFVSYSRKQALDQAAFDVKAGIEQAKQVAVSRVKPAGLSGPLDRYRIVFCDKNAAPNTTSCLTDPANNLYEIDALSDTTIMTLVSKKRPSTVAVTTSGPCVDRLRFYILKASDAVTGCKIKLSSTLTTSVKTVCVDAGGNASIYNSDATCP